jgi:hypothetical protein
MPIEYRVDSSGRLVFARGFGALTDSDVFGYQKEVWSSPDVAGYDELIDMTNVDSVVLPTKAWELASTSAHDDLTSGGGRLAIVAPQDWAYGLGRMYETYRDLDPKSTKRVAVFRTLAEALAFLGRDSPATASKPISCGAIEK